MLRLYLCWQRLKDGKSAPAMYTVPFYSQYLWKEKPPTWDNAEDIQFAYSAQKYGNIKTYCPPHPKNDMEMHGSIMGNELGIDNKATSTNSAVSHQQLFSERDFCVQYALKNGWKTVRGVTL